MTPDYVIIKPKEGSRKFKAIGGMQSKYIETKDGKEVVKDGGQYKSERFPKSRQMFRPIWSYSKRKYLLDGFEENGEKLNSLVAQCKLKYPDNHPKKTHYIEEADLYDFNDPFLSHKQLKVIAEEGSMMLDKNRPFDKIILAGLKKNKFFQVSGEENPVLSGSVKYIIVDNEEEKKIKRAHRDRKMEVYELYKSLSDDKKIKIAMAMDLINSETIDRGMLDDILFQAAEDTGKANSVNMSKQDLFIKLCKLDTEELNRRHMVGKAKVKGILRYRSDQGYILFGKPIGKNLDKVNEYLSDSENAETLIRMQEALDEAN